MALPGSYVDRGRLLGYSFAGRLGPFTTQISTPHLTLKHHCQFGEWCFYLDPPDAWYRVSLDAVHLW